MAAVGKALVLKKTGGPDAFELDSAWSVGPPQAGDVLVKLAATSVNPVDTYIRSGAYGPLAKTPEVIGGDVAGVVLSAGPGSSWRKGDQVIALTDGFISKPESRGTYAEHVLCKEDWLAKAPSSMSLINAAGIPLVALTAWQALARATPKAQQRILILGASGGVGQFAVQLAKRVHHLHVVAVCSASNAEFVKSLGADEVFTYDTQGGAQGLATLGATFDAVFDVIGGDMLAVSAGKCLKPGGCVTHIMNRGTDAAANKEYEAKAAAGTGPAFHTTLVTPNGGELARISTLIDEKVLSMNVAKVMPLEDAGAANELVMTGHAGGKVVLKM